MFFDLANSALAVLVIGLLISLAFLLPENQGRLEQSASTTLQGLRIVSGLWFFISIGYLLSSLAEIFGSGIGEILKVNILHQETYDRKIVLDSKVLLHNHLPSYGNARTLYL